MLANYIKIAFRNMWRYGAYTIINVGGLAIALICCLLIMLFVRHEFSFDDFHENASQIYRLAVREDYGEDRVHHNTKTPLALGPAMQSSYPEIDAMVRIAAPTDLVKQGGRVFTERIHLVEPSFFEVFDFPLSLSQSENPLSQRDNILLTEKMAVKYFGTEDPVGKTISIRMGGSFVDYTVAGIVHEAPDNSSIRFDFLMSFENGDLRWGKGAFTSFFSVIPETYVRLTPGASVDDLRAKVITLGEQIMGDQDGVYEIQLQPLTDIHLNTYYPAGLEPISDPSLSYILTTIALLVLMIACINFITLSVSRATYRAKEVGIRKVVGASRNQLTRQFWGETFIMILISLSIALLLTNFLMPIFNQLSGKMLALSFDGFTFLAIAVILIVTGCIAGGYPSFVLSKFSPYEALKGALPTGSASGFRRILMVAQFSLSMVLMIGVLMMNRQLGFLRTKPLGYKKDHVVVLPTGLPHTATLRLLERFQNELDNRQEIQQMTAVRCAFGEGWIWLGYHDNNNNYRSFNFNIVDYNFLSTMKLELAQGRDFSREMSSDFEQAIIINEALVAEYGWENPIGQKLPGRFQEHQVIGVVRDFHYFSMHAPIEPLVMVLDSRNILSGASDQEIHAGRSDVVSSSTPGSKLIVRISPDSIPETMDFLERTWMQVTPALPFDFYFTDEAVDRQYRQEERLETIVRYATLLAILIACMGLFGLVTLTTGKRIKEIGVRKVLGASVVSIVILIAKDFMQLIFISFCLAIPVAYLAVQQWLQSFAFRTEISVMLFLLVGMLTMIIALATISYQAIRAASQNPVESLRYE